MFWTLLKATRQNYFLYYHRWLERCWVLLQVRELVSSLCAEQTASMASRARIVAVTIAQMPTACAWVLRVLGGTSRHPIIVSHPHAPNKAAPVADHQASTYASAAADTISPTIITGYHCDFWFESLTFISHSTLFATGEWACESMGVQDQVTLISIFINDRFVT